MKDDDDDRIDLTPLEPSPARWEAMVASVAARAAAARAPGLPQQLAAWARPALAMAAMVVVVVWAATLLRGRPEPVGPEPVGRSSDGVYQLVDWARRGEVPDVDQFMEVIDAR
jgi:hypothetical protein